MRPSVQLRLFIVGLIAFGLWTSIARAVGPRFPFQFGGPGKVPPPPVVQKELEGMGKTEERARQDAVEEVQRWMAENLHIGWTPPAKYLEDRHMVRFEEREPREFEASGRMQVVAVKLSITRPQLDEMRDIARQGVRKERQAGALRVLAGLVALLLVAGGYLRLEEATRGYYTGLLRLAAAGLLAAVGVGLWFLRW